MTDRPLVSVITPSYNYGRFLGPCLDSVRAQTWPRVEHLVLDACSTDDSRAVIEARKGQYDLRAWFEKDDGQADAIARGFERARGEILCWLNADDYWLHDRVVERAVAALESCDVVSAGGVYVDEAGRRGKSIEAARSSAELRHHDPILQPATFWRRSVNRPLDKRLHYAFDWQLFLEMEQGGARFEFIQEEWAAYRMHGVNKTAADPAKRRREIADILRSSCGPASPQHLWARAVYGGFAAAEKLDSRALKRAVQLANLGMCWITGKRIYSC